MGKENATISEENHKIRHESHDKMKGGINSRRKNLSGGKNQKRHLPWILVLGNPIRYSNDVTQVRT